MSNFRGDTTAREFLLKDHEKDEFIRLMRKAAAFCGVEILTHAVMSNHYHLVIHINQDKALLLTNEEVISRWSRLFHRPQVCHESK